MTDEQNPIDAMIETIDTLFGVVIESEGKITRHSMRTELELDGVGECELILTLRVKGAND